MLAIHGNPCVHFVEWRKKDRSLRLLLRPFEDAHACEACRLSRFARPLVASVACSPNRRPRAAHPCRDYSIAEVGPSRCALQQAPPGRAALGLILWTMLRCEDEYSRHITARVRSFKRLKPPSFSRSLFICQKGFWGPRSVEFQLKVPHVFFDGDGHRGGFFAAIFL